MMSRQMWPATTAAHGARSSGLVLVFTDTATYAPSAAASAARSDDEGDASEHRPRREAPCDEAERRPTRARSDPRPARVSDRAPAPPAPAGLAGLCIPLMRAHVSGPPADVRSE